MPLACSVASPPFQPHGITVDASNGRIFVTSTFSCQIFSCNLDGTNLTALPIPTFSSTTIAYDRVADLL